MAHAYTAYADVARKSLGKFKKASFHVPSLHWMPFLPHCPDPRTVGIDPLPSEVG
jgi:hypothetical protein